MHRCHPNHLVYKLITSNDNDNESGFVISHSERDSQLKDSHEAAQKCHIFFWMELKIYTVLIMI